MRRIIIAGWFIFWVAYFLFHFKWVSISQSQTDYSTITEDFDPALMRLNSVDKLICYIDSLYGSSTIAVQDSEIYAKLVQLAVQKRFYHAYSLYDLKDNCWIWLVGNLFWSHISAVIIPEDLLQYPMAACSQQSIVAMEVLHKKGYARRAVGLEGHFTYEAFYYNNWHHFDANKEIKFVYNDSGQIASAKDLDEKSDLRANAYQNNEAANYLFYKPPLSMSHRYNPGWRMRILHQFLHFWLYIAWAIPILVWAYSNIKLTQAKTTPVDTQIAPVKPITLS
jgi:hypothetical protein